jgi:hypothetical protein
MQNGRNQCSGMADTDPEHEIGNTPRPTHRNVVSPNTNPGVQEVQNTKNPEAGE